MSANDADPTREMGIIPVTSQPTNPAEDFDAPIENNGVQLDSYAKANSANADNQDKELNFSAEDIAKRQQADYFVKVEGAERRQRKAEKAERQRNRKLFNKLRHENPEKHKDAKLQNANTSEERKIIQQQKAQTRAEGRRIGFIKFKKFFFGGKRKIITFTILALAIIVPTGLSLYFNVYLPERERREDAAYEEYRKKGSAVVMATLDYASEIKLAGGTNEEVKAYYEKTINKYSKDSPEYFMLMVNYYYSTNRVNDAINALKSLESQAKYDYQKEYLYHTIGYCYTLKQEFTKADIYFNKVNSLKRRVYEENIKSSKELYDSWH
jgi:hypothetical protein